MALLHFKSSTYLLLHSYCNISEMGLHSTGLQNYLFEIIFLGTMSRVTKPKDSRELVYGNIHNSQIL